MQNTSSIFSCRSVMDVEYSATSVGISVGECHKCDCDGKCSNQSQSVFVSKDLNFALSLRLVPLLIVGYMACITSSKFYLDSDFNHFSGAVYFWGALAFTVVNFLLVSTLYGERQSACTFASHLMSILREKPSSSSSHLLLAGVSSISAGYYLLATVIADQSTRNSTALESQSCKRAAVGCIPHDRVMICYLMPIIVQLSLKNTAIQTAFYQWLTATIFVTISIVHVQGWQQLWTLLYSMLFLFITFKIDLHIKKSSIVHVNTHDKVLDINMSSFLSHNNSMGKEHIVDSRPDIPTPIATPFRHGHFTSSLTKDRLIRATNSQVIFLQSYS
jgi:hypothetical protein